MNKQLLVSNESSNSNSSARVSLRDLAPASFPAIPVPSTLPDGKTPMAPAVPLSVTTHAEGMLCISRYAVDVKGVPVDFFADPDGQWDFDTLVEAAGFEPDNPGVCIGALMSFFDGHPAGSAVVTEVGRARSYVAIVECPVVGQGSAEASASAAVGQKEPASPKPAWATRAA